MIVKKTLSVQLPSVYNIIYSHLRQEVGYPRRYTPLTAWPGRLIDRGTASIPFLKNICLNACHKKSLPLFLSFPILKIYFIIRACIICAFSSGAHRAHSCLSHFSAVDVLLGFLESSLEQLFGCESCCRDPRCELASSNNGVGAGARADGAFAHDEGSNKDSNGDETGEVESGIDGFYDNGSVLVVKARDKQGSDREVDDGDDGNDGRCQEVGKWRRR